MIPEPLSAVAAEMVTAHDRMLREREAFGELLTRQRNRALALFYVQIGGLTATGIALVAVIWR